MRVFWGMKFWSENEKGIRRSLDWSEMSCRVEVNGWNGCLNDPHKWWRVGSLSSCCSIIFYQLARVIKA